MKHRLSLLALAVSMLLAACDPEFSTTYTFSNLTDQDATIYLPDATISLYQVRFGESILVPANDSLVIVVGGGVGQANFEDLFWEFSTQIMPDSCTIEFSDGTRQTYLATDTTSDDSPYNPHSSHYTYTEEVRQSQPFMGMPYFGNLTYTLTK